MSEFWVGSVTAAPEERDFYPGSDETLTYGRDLSNLGGLSRIGLHWERLLPGHRSSWPHSEEREEEFVLVIKGQVDAWLNGVIYPMKEGDIAMFPAGTGIAHTFINNSDSEAILFVGGERAVPNNRRYYPLNPERRSAIPPEKWWDDAPHGELGSHDGMPDQVRAVNKE
jgi:uncharacterized cupin superfamily protein